MRTTEVLSITLPHDVVQMVKDKVASGEYGSESDVIRDGLRSLEVSDASVENWLGTEVAETYDRVMADPKGASLCAEEARSRLTAYMEAAVRKASRE